MCRHPARSHYGDVLRQTVLVSLAAALALLAAGCGGGDETSATADWANGVCTAITTWTSSIQSAASSIQDNPTKEGLQSAADDATQATKMFADDIKGLGAPDTDSGQQAKSSLDSLADQVETSADEISSAVDSSAGTLAAISAISGTLTTMADQVSSTFEQLEELDAGDELRDAFDDADSCDELQRSR
jgi:hypothetical protein